MLAELPLLDIADARPAGAPGGASAPSFNLRLMPGELALIQAGDGAIATWFADLCCGLVSLASGAVRFLGRDWTQQPLDQRAALRGRIGRVFAEGSWIQFLDTATNILLPQLHHSRENAAALRDRAAGLARRFGLPGLPLGRPDELSPADAARAACVRAFLGDPLLLLLDNPLQGRFIDLLPPLLNALAAARDRGAAAIWLTRSALVWNDRSFPAAHRLRLGHHGLVQARRTA